MKLISVNVGQPRDMPWRGETITTGIFKEPVPGSIRMRQLNLDGDRQADLTVHGGVSKAVYVYPVEHYDYWRKELPDMELPWGMFGENLTIKGLLEDEVNIGDRFRIGTTEVMVTEPRMPCYKLGIRFGRDDMVKRFLASRRTGFYLAVLKEGEVKAGDVIELFDRDKNDITVADITRLYAFKKNDVDTLARVVQLEPLSDSWRGYFQDQLDKLRQARTSV